MQAFIVVIVLVFLVLVIGQGRRSRLRNCLRLQVNKRSGKINEQGFFKNPELVFSDELGEITVRLEKPRGPGGPRSCWIARCPVQTLREISMRVYPQTTGKKIDKLFGLRDVEIESPEFDERFIIDTKDEDSARRLLTPPLQKSLLELDSQDFEFHIRRGNVRFREPVSGVLADIFPTEKSLDQFLDKVLLVFRQLNKELSNA